MRRVIENKQLMYVAKSKDRMQKAFQTDDMKIRYHYASDIIVLPICHHLSSITL